MLAEFIRSHKVVTLIIVVVLITFISFAIFTLSSRIGKEPVNVYLVPNDTRLLVDGQQISPGMAYLKPGTYSLSATREGFESFESTITIGQPNTEIINIALAPESEDALRWQEENMDLYYDTEGRAGTEAVIEGQKLIEKNPIVNDLPFGNFIYTIGYRADPTDPSGLSIILEIDAITGYRETALDKIREFGFNPTNYEINFNNYENPFSHE